MIEEGAEFGRESTAWLSVARASFRVGEHSCGCALSRLLRRVIVIAWIGFGAFGGSLARAADAEDSPDPAKLIALVVSQQTTGGSKTRARLTIESTRDADRTVQVLIKTRSEGGTNDTLVVAMWPREIKGQAWMLRRQGPSGFTGFRFAPPDVVTPLAESGLDAELFGSDLSVGDFAESFWEWPGAKLAGEEKVGNSACWIVEMQTDSAAVRHPRVRCWISKEKPVALRIEKRDSDGMVRKRLTAGRVVRRDEGGWAVAEWTVESLSEGSRTRVVGTRSDRDLKLSEEEFTPAGVRALVSGDADRRN